MPAPRVVVSGLGFVTSIGNDRAAVTASLRALRSGIETCEFIPGANLPIKVVGTIKEFDTTALQWAGWRWPEGYKFKREVLRGMAPHGLYALCRFLAQLLDGQRQQRFRLVPLQRPALQQL